jgi:hypothetical protein
MKKNLAVMAAVMLGFLMTTVSATAQYSGRMYVSVPFSFVVENQQFQPGSYVIEKIANGRLRIHTDDGQVSASFLALPAEGRKTAERAQFIFHRYGQSYFLANIWTPGQNIGWEVMEGKVEQEAAKKRNVPLEIATLTGR